MAIHVIKVPDIGEGIAEVELVAWHVKPGDEVVADQVVAEVMTDKATVEVPSTHAGRIVAVNGEPGDKLAVGSDLLRIKDTVAGDDGAAPTVHSHPAPPSATAAPAPAPSPSPGAAAPQPAVAAAAPRAAYTLESPAHAPLAAPSVRRHARELGVDLRQVTGTGPEGRIRHEDVVAFAQRGATVAGGSARYAKREGETAIPVIGLRRQIANRMHEALRIPHFTYVEEIDVTELEALRVHLNDAHGATRGRLTMLPFLMRAIVLAVPAFPQMNARYDDTRNVVTRFAPVHIGIATQSDAGLMVPVVRHAEARDPWQAAAEIARLATAARAGKATRDELTGSTITVTSLGPLGGIVTTPVINPPEVAIVGVNRIVERPALHHGAIVPRKLMNLSSSFDHRVIDGADAARFVQALRRYLECPALLFVD
ncbi:MAG: 2-oxo acid dehydrogenase subunit E2 [Burkholderiales bacterium]|nr:2-oxo acid dehydrogenase subunit E2 [Burkholderiales bacterium]